MDDDRNRRSRIIGFAVIAAAMLGMVLMIVAIISALRPSNGAESTPQPPTASGESRAPDPMVEYEAGLATGELLYARLAGVDLSGWNLAGAELALADLSNAALSRADLAGAALEGAILRDADLTDADLEESNLSYADLRRARLLNANLQNAVLTAADLRLADLTGADFTGANLSGANLSQAALDGAILADVVADGQTIWPEGYTPANLVADEFPPIVKLDLPLEVGIFSAVLPAYASLAAPGDTARADFPGDYYLLPQVDTGARMAVFKSAALAEQLVPRMAADLDMIGYNLEHGPLNPLAEQRDPVAAVAALRNLADTYGLTLAIGPDHDFALSHGADLAPYADRFVLQIQSVQQDPAVARDFVLPLADALRAANPDLEIYVQVRADGAIVELAGLLDSLAPQMDGVSILTKPDGAAELVSLVRAVRPSVGPASDTTGPAVVKIPAPAAAGNGARGWTLLGALLVQLLVIGLLTVVIVSIFRNA